MNKENAIEVRNLKKSFRVYYDKGTQLKEKVLFRSRNRYENREVLKGISFDVKKGEAIGLIGHNGCGKSTTLKLLTRIIYPDEGSIEMKGRVSSLIELGAGFHPDMSGRENIYTNASIFGLSKKEIEARMQDIIDFSEIEEFIDNPVRTYSSGMYMRLAFSVAINVDADILLIDEILAVGDVNFQAKCFDKLRQIKAEGTTIVIVSHSLGQIEEICDRSYWIDGGEIRKEGSPRQVHRAYMEYMNGYSMNAEIKKNSKPEEKKDIEEESTTDEQPKETNEKVEIKDDGPIDPLAVKKSTDSTKSIRIKQCKLLGKDGEEKKAFITGESASVEIDYEVIDDECGEASVELAVYRNDGIECYETNTFREGIPNRQLTGNGKIRYSFNKLNFITGEYWIDIGIRKKNGFPFDYKEKACIFKMTSLDRERGIAYMEHEWKYE